MDIKKLTLNELKILAYDMLTLIEQTDHSLRVVNQEIAGRKVVAPTLPPIKQPAKKQVVKPTVFEKLAKAK